MMLPKFALALAYSLFSQNDAMITVPYLWIRQAGGAGVKPFCLLRAPETFTMTKSKCYLRDVVDHEWHEEVASCVTATLVYRYHNNTQSQRLHHSRDNNVCLSTTTLHTANSCYSTHLHISHYM